ncbi:MAG: hypothetical protein H6Q84_623 [Deltaproteobacteria bacterium]|nr:hypothetical protein [Deltaproteobacteria bacterium]
MAEKIRYTRRDLKGPDEFISTFGRFVEWCKANRSKVVIALIAFHAVLFLYLGTGAYFRWQERKAGTDLWPYLEQAREILAAPAVGATGDIAAVEQSIASLVKQHAGTRAALYGQCSLGSIAFSRGDYEGSAARFREGIQAGKDVGVVRFLLRKGLAASLEAKGDYAGAAASYREAAEAAGGPQLATQARFGEARALELSGKKKEAAALYRKIIEENPETRIKDQIDIKIAHME